MAQPEEIVEACRRARQNPANVDDCNKFAKAVATHFGVTLTGTADNILTEIAGPDWTSHGTSGAAAAIAAAAGGLVIGGMTAAALGGAHGHVVVVVAGPLNRGKYPTAYWGSLNPKIRAPGGLGTTLNFSFSRGDRDRVVYASRPV